MKKIEVIKNGSDNKIWKIDWESLTHLFGIPKIKNKEPEEAATFEKIMSERVPESLRNYKYTKPGSITYLKQNK